MGSCTLVAGEIFPFGRAACGWSASNRAMHVRNSLTVSSSVATFASRVFTEGIAELPTVTKKKKKIVFVTKFGRDYENASKKYDFSVIRNRMLPPFISDRKSKHPTFILA